MTVDRTAKALGGLIGGALGDAIGEMAFIHSAKEALEGAVARSDTLVYTDDTAMAIGIAEVLAEAGNIDPERLGRRFHDNYLREPWRGYGSGPPTVFAMVERQGLSYVEAARRLFGGEGSLGNGAAMRAAPVGLAYHGRADLVAKARASALVTHAHPVGVDGAIVQALAVAQAVALDPGSELDTEAFCLDLIEAAQTREIRDRIALVRRLLAENTSARRAADAIGRSVLVHESMPFALYAFLAHPDSFEACLMCAILNGGDRDTLGAMAGAISGAYLGIDAIPRDWRRRLEKGAYIERLAGELAQLA